MFIVLGMAFIPLWIIPSTVAKLSAGVFWVQFGVQGAMGVTPILIAELSPPGFCALFLGIVYQVGNVRLFCLGFFCLRMSIKRVPGDK
jgi:MFS transporter, SHS family, lactate transporter